GGLFYVNQLIVQYPESALAIGVLAFIVLKKATGLELPRRLIPIAIVWGVVVFAVITLMATKIPQYMLPLSVPVALLGGYVLELLAARRLSRANTVALMVLLALTTSWSAVWPLRAYVKTSVLGIGEVNPYATLSWLSVVLAVACVGLTGYVLVHRADWKKSIVHIQLVPILLLAVLTLRVFVEVMFNDRTQHNIGTQQIASMLREQHAQRVIYLGKDLNPALDLYLKGWDTWRTDIRLDYYLSEATALAPMNTMIEPAREEEETFLVEEMRIAGEPHYANLRSVKGSVEPVFVNASYRVYRLSLPG
ncbi:MAG: hypothetical protein AAB393_14795, partial [Bacteroidota bacterium]